MCGQAALIQINKRKKRQILKLNHIEFEINTTSIKGSHPPKNNITFKALISNILEYSPKENKAKPMAEYSTLYK